MKISEVVNEVVARILGLTKIKLEIVTFSSLMNFDGSSGKDYVVKSVTGDCTINIVNAKDGDSGIIELILDAVGGYTITLGSMFTKRISEAIDTAASKDNFISWQKIGTDIVYSVATVQ